MDMSAARVKAQMTLTHTVKKALLFTLWFAFSHKLSW